MPINMISSIDVALTPLLKIFFLQNPSSSSGSEADQAIEADG